MSDTGGERDTKYQCWTKGGVLALGQDCQIRIQLSTPFAPDSGAHTHTEIVEKLTLTLAYESNFGDLSLPLDGSQGGILHQEKFEAGGQGAGGKTVGSLNRRLDLDVGQSGIVGRGITISRDGHDFLHGVIGWGVAQN